MNMTSRYELWGQQSEWNRIPAWAEAEKMEKSLPLSDLWKMKDDTSKLKDMFLRTFHMNQQK